MGRKAFIAAFIGLLLLPLAQMATGALPMPPLDENRRLSPPPGPDTPWHRVPHVAERWFADHFGLRPLLVRAKAQLDWSLFGRNDRVLVGRDGQLFYRSTVNVEPPVIERMVTERGEAMAANMARFAEALHRADIGLVAMSNLMSDRFYPELLPDEALRRPAEPAIDRLLARFAATPHVTWVDATAIQRRAMAERRIFHRTDFHWNDPAAHDVAKAIVDAIAAAEGVPSPWKHPLLVETRRFRGGVASFMPLFVPPSEQGLFTKQNWDWPAGMEVGPAPPFEVRFRFPPAPGRLPPMLLVGDSFSDAFSRNGMDVHFDGTWRLRWRATGMPLSEIAAAIPPEARWMVFQFIEVQMAALNALADDADVARAVAILDARPRR